MFKEHSIGFLLAFLMTSTVVLPAAHDLYHTRLEVGHKSTMTGEHLAHTHPSQRSLGNACHRGLGSDVNCLLCMLAPVWGIEESPGGFLDLDRSFLGRDAERTLLFAHQSDRSIRGPPSLA